MNVPHQVHAAEGPARFLGKNARKATLLLGGGALIVALGALWHFTGADSTPAGGPRRAAAAPVRVAQVVRRDMAVIERTPGTVVANTIVQVTARVPGILEAANFKEGAFVKKGDLLFRIDPMPFQAALAQAKALLLRDQAQWANANRDKQLYENLNKVGAVSTQQRDASATSAEVLAATVAADEAAVNLAQLNLGYTQIRSPLNGKTGTLLIQPGNMVGTNANTPLVTIAQIQPIKISFNLPQSDLPLIQARQKTKGLTATVDFSDTGGKPISAPVDFTGNAVNNQSGTIELRATFDNADSSLVPGQLVNVTVELNDIPNALVVPRDAINDGPDGSYIYIVSGGKAVQHGAKVLFDDTKNVAIESDVQPGDRVITEGQLRVEPGAAVDVLAARGQDGDGAGAP